MARVAATLRFALVALIQSTETHAAVDGLVGGSSLNDALRHLEGLVVRINGCGYRIRNFVLGDHMAQAKLLGADTPTCTAPTRHVCPWCHDPPATTRNYSAASTPITDVHHPV